jgi:hypothetical protein
MDVRKVVEELKGITTKTQLTNALENDRTIFAKFNMHSFGMVKTYIRITKKNKYLFIIKPYYGKARLIVTSNLDNILKSAVDIKEFYTFAKSLPNDLITPNTFIATVCQTRRKGILASLYEFLLRKRVGDLEDYFYTLEDNDYIREECL